MQSSIGEPGGRLMSAGSAMRQQVGRRLDIIGIACSQTLCGIVVILCFRGGGAEEKSIPGTSGESLRFRWLRRVGVVLGVGVCDGG